MESKEVRRGWRRVRVARAWTIARRAADGNGFSGERPPARRLIWMHGLTGDLAGGLRFVAALADERPPAPFGINSNLESKEVRRGGTAGQDRLCVDDCSEGGR